MVPLVVVTAIVVFAAYEALVFGSLKDKGPAGRK